MSRRYNKAHYLKNQDKIRQSRRDSYRENPQPRRLLYETAKGRASRLASSALIRDKVRGFPEPTRINPAEIVELLEAGHCEATGQTFDLGPSPEGQTRNPMAPSIDRLDRDHPYIKADGTKNWRLVIWMFNNAVGEAGEDVLTSSVVEPLILARGANPFPLETPKGMIITWGRQSPATI